MDWVRWKWIKTSCKPVLWIGYVKQAQIGMQPVKAHDLELSAKWRLAISPPRHAPSFKRSGFCWPNHDHPFYQIKTSLEADKSISFAFLSLIFCPRESKTNPRLLPSSSVLAFSFHLFVVLVI